MRLFSSLRHVGLFDTSQVPGFGGRSSDVALVGWRHLLCSDRKWNSPFTWNDSQCLATPQPSPGNKNKRALRLLIFDFLSLVSSP
jgi:hypothetical protein